MWLRLTVPCVLLMLLAGQSHQAGRHRRQGGSFGGKGGCETPKMTSGQCINIKKCPELLGMLKNRSNRTVSQYLRDSQCGFENKVPKVCCPSETQGSVVPSGGGASLPGIDVCGKNGLIPDKVVKGRPADLGSWPWMVALGYRTSKKPLLWSCGGTLISDRFVLTAAHCVMNLGSQTLYMARVGDLNLKDSVKDKATPIDIPVERSIPHENYNPKTFTVDIALVKLKNKVQFTQLIRPACLPTPDTFESDLTGYTPFITGWGATSYKGPSDTHLQEAQVEITDTESCAISYQAIKGATIDDRVICAASSSGQDTCQGDSGGPLLLPKVAGKGVNYFLVGVVSYGYKCAEPGFPGIYSKVSLYLDWIKKNMMKKQD